jgi:Pyridine nucleotide-disulphide oxidoreductase
MPADWIDVAVVGAGPYGISIASHLKRAGVEYRIFGSPMQTWREQMPEGMLLRSEGCASSISDPVGDLSFERYRDERRLQAGEWAKPIPLDVYNEYAQWFITEQRIRVEDSRLERVTPHDGAFDLVFSDGEEVRAGRVVIAVGLTHFAHVPHEIADLPADLISHSSRPLKMGDVAGRRVAVVGAGQSALETAALLHERGAEVVVLARRASLIWHPVPPPRERPMVDRVRYPIGGLGLGWKPWVAGHAPNLVRRLPASKRVALAQRSFGPAGAWWLRDRVEGRVEVRTQTILRGSGVHNGTARLTLDGPAGTSVFDAEHVVAATGYRVDLERLTFFDSAVRSSIRMTAHHPALSPDFESSLPALHFVGAPATNTFGPVMRFVFGTRHAAHRIARAAKRPRRAAL